VWNLWSGWNCRCNLKVKKEKEPNQPKAENYDAQILQGMKQVVPENDQWRYAPLHTGCGPLDCSVIPEASPE
jgi:hypothetical protein